MRMTDLEYSLPNNAIFKNNILFYLLFSFGLIKFYYKVPHK